MHLFPLWAFMACYRVNFILLLFLRSVVKVVLPNVRVISECIVSVFVLHQVLHWCINSYFTGGITSVVINYYSKLWDLRTVWHVPGPTALWMLLEMPYFRFRNSLCCTVSSNEWSDPSARCANASNSICKFFLCFHEKGYSVPTEFLCTRTSLRCWQQLLIIVIITVIIIIVWFSG